MLKKFFFLFFLAFLFTLFNINLSVADETANESTAFTLYEAPLPVPTTAVFYNKDKQPVFLSDFKGKVLILNFWKATCRKCLAELPSLNRLADAFPTDLKVIAVSQGPETADRIETVLHEERRLANIDVSLDDNQTLFTRLSVEKVPYTFLIDKDGRIVGYIKGQADFDAESIHTQIKELLK